MSSTLSATVHLRAWLLEEIESHLQETLQHVLDWTADLLTQLWADVQLPKLILEAWHILPPTAFKHFLDFAVRNYRSEVPQALLKSFMQRILSTGLATQPLTTEYGASASHILEYHASPANAGSARSQVRASQTRNIHVLSEPAMGARVSCTTPGQDEAAPCVAKSGTCDRIRKRTLKRALTRAIRNGQSTYCGRPIRVWHPDITAQSAVSVPKEAQHGKQERIQCIHWNCSGLSSELQLEWFTCSHG